jgi:outer membrane lipoprotein-sorting protein
MRHGLLLTAVATVTVPGLLAMLAVVGHEHVAAETGVSAAALDGAPLSGPVPVAPAAARATVRDNAAGAQGASGAPVTVLSRVTVGQQVMGMRLLTGAANAGLDTSYQGTEQISQSGVDGSVQMISQVWHQGGGLTLVETSDGTTVSAAARTAAPGVASSDPVSDSPEGVFGVTKSLVALLSKHYVAVYLGTGAAVGRAATVVEVYRSDGSVAARYWLDKQTMVPLRRELYDTSENVISEDSFVQVKFGALAPSQFAAANLPGSRRTRPPGSPRRSSGRAGGCQGPCQAACRCTRPHRPRQRPARSSTLSTRTGSTSSRSSCSGAPWRRICPAGSRWTWAASRPSCRASR